MAADAAAHLRRSGASTADCFQDENAGPADSFASMTAAFSQRISELQQLVCFRVEDSVKHIFVRDIQGIEASVRALEQLFDELQQRTQQEMAVIPKARALLHAAELQRQHLQQISNGLPQHLPGAPAASTQQSAAAAVLGSGSSGQPRGQLQQYGAAVVGVRGPATVPGTGAAAMGDDGKGGAAQRSRERRRRDGGGTSSAAAAAPRWYVTAAELASTPGYMKGRLTLEKVNAALDELASHAEASAKLMSAVARNQLGRVAAEERQRLHDVYHALALKEATKGRHWFLESDLKAGQAVRMDKTGKSILMLLRHLGRLTEVRTVLQSGSGGSITAYVLQPQAA